MFSFLSSARTRSAGWIKNGMPLIPAFQMNSRSPHFVLLVLVLFALGMIVPELFGLTSGSTYPPLP